MVIGICIYHYSTKLSALHLPPPRVRPSRPQHNCPSVSPTAPGRTGIYRNLLEWDATDEAASHGCWLLHAVVARTGKKEDALHGPAREINTVWRI
jgi:hypothetical protein